MAVTMNAIHVNEQWTLLQVRGDLEDADGALIADAVVAERPDRHHVAVDLSNAHEIPTSLPEALSGIEYVVVLTENDGVAAAFRAAGVPVYESLDIATGDVAPLLRDAGDLSGDQRTVSDVGEVPFTSTGGD